MNDLARYRARFLIGVAPIIAAELVGRLLELALALHSARGISPSRDLYRYRR